MRLTTHIRIVLSFFVYMPSPFRMVPPLLILFTTWPPPISLGLEVIMLNTTEDSKPTKIISAALDAMNKDIKEYNTGESTFTKIPFVLSLASTLKKPNIPDIKTTTQSQKKTSH